MPSAAARTGSPGVGGGSARCPHRSAPAGSPLRPGRGCAAPALISRRPPAWLMRCKWPAPQPGERGHKGATFPNPALNGSPNDTFPGFSDGGERFTGICGEHLPTYMHGGEFEGTGGTAPHQASWLHSNHRGRCHVLSQIARTHHVQGESYLVYNILSSGEIECSNTLEDELDQALPSQAFIYRPVRQRVYSLLLGGSEDDTSTGPTVKEWFVYPGNPLKHPDLVRPLPMTVPGGTPSLKILWLNQEPEAQARRLDTLLACFNLSSSKEELQAVESPFKALCCLLIYLFVQVDTLCLEDLQAFIAQALCLQGKSTAQLVNLQLDYVNPRAVQLGSLLVRGLTTLALVNSACGFPWKTSEFMPWNVFDGKLFHQKYLHSEKGHAVEVLLEQNRSRLTKFHNLKAVVCRACLKENRRIVGRAHWDSHHTGRWGRQGSSSHRTSSGYSRSGQGQPWRDQGPGSRQHEHDQWRRY
ncbi:constitutive coactivator of peroxisome proliferator-activated receptor gamma isoform X10 [Oryctolagus cuniculus]|uniref:constitutive coactivator of peroxisome proliferator-activated receptor gamma isoform X10 n=2 Tax=Oryctolagus cuniculus TaxID=9986 RepID=UPI00387961A9